jgi:hypothetical protein
MDLHVTNVGGVPASGVQAVVLNVTVTNPTDNGYLTIYPAGAQRPLASNLNFSPGLTVPNLVAVAVGDGGNVTIYNSHGTSDVVADVQGYVEATSSGATGTFHELTPARILDTRPESGQPGAGQRLGPSTSLDVQVTGARNVPSSDVSAVVLNVTVTNPTVNGYLTVFPAGVEQPLASNVNFGPGQTIPNRVIVPVGSGGRVTVYNSHGFSDVVMDVAGWYAAAGGAEGTKFTRLLPARILDSRMGLGYTSARRLGPTATAKIQVAGRGGVPSMSSSAPPKAVVLNVNVTETDDAAYLTVFPSGAAQPLASDLNWAPGQTAPNLVVVKLGTGGAVDMYNSKGNAAVIADVMGFFS